MIRTPIRFHSGPGLSLAGVLALPEEGTGPFPGVVLCNGFLGGKHIYMPQVAEVLARHGYASLAFDYRGFGDSEGIRWRLIPEEQLVDIGNALSRLAMEPAVHGGRLGLWGTSLGASHAVSVAAADPRVGCVVANAPIGSGRRQAQWLRPGTTWTEFKRRLEADRRRRVTTGESEYVHPFEVMPYDEDSRRLFEQSLALYPERREIRLPIETADRLLEYAPEMTAELIAPRALLLISAERDELTPPSEQRSIFERAREPKRLVVIAGATHYGLYRPPHFDEVLRLSIEWFDLHLSARPGPAPG